MPIPKNKTELIQAIEINYQKLVVDLKAVPTPLASKVDLEGHAKGTKMSICNLVSYLIGWEMLVLKWHRKKSKDQAIDFPDTDFNWNELGLLAQKFYTDYNHLDYPQLLKKLDQTTLKILKITQTTSNKDLYEMDWYKKYTFGRMIQLNTSSPFMNARKRVRKWVRSERYKNYQT